VLNWFLQEGGGGKGGEGRGRNGTLDSLRDLGYILTVKNGIILQ
jgi:hypothetical protein